MNFIKKNWKGVLLCLMIAIPSWILGKIFPIVGGPVFAILLGMVITLLVSDKSALQSGITFVSKKILQYAVILLGFGMNLSVILQTGKQSLPIILATITTSLVVAWVLHKILHVPGKISTLIGVGSSICGRGSCTINFCHFLFQYACRFIFSYAWHRSRFFPDKRRSFWYFCRNCCE